MNWCKKQRLFDETKLELYTVDEQSEQYGLRTLCDLNENDLLLAIPRKYMLTNEDALRDPVFGEFAAVRNKVPVPFGKSLFHKILGGLVNGRLDEQAVSDD